MNVGGAAAVASLALILAEHALKTHPLGRAIVFCLTAYAIVRAVADREDPGVGGFDPAAASTSADSTVRKPAHAIKRLLSTRV